MRTNRKTKKEIWVPCPGFEKWYDISNHARVRSYHTYHGAYDRKKIEVKLMGIQYSPEFEYLYVVLSKGIGVAYTHSLHILVAKAFVPNPFKRKHVHHKDNDKTNPCAWNLKWVTPGQNQKLAYRDGQRKRPNGTLNGRCKLTETQVLEIFNSDENSYKLASKYKVTNTLICNIWTGKAWSSVTGKKFVKSDKKDKLPKKTVLAIYNHKASQSDIAKLFETKKPIVSAIKTGRSYSSITGANFTGNKIYNYG